jgi:hypothetical protein
MRSQGQSNTCKHQHRAQLARPDSNALRRLRAKGAIDDNHRTQRKGVSAIEQRGFPIDAIARYSVIAASRSRRKMQVVLRRPPDG